MNYQQWKSVAEIQPPLGKWVTVTPGGYVMRGRFDWNADGLYCEDWRGRRTYDCLHWSWSETEPDAEQLMVKPHGIFMAHWWNEAGHLLRIIHDFEVRFFVEIGLLDGGLTSIMLDEVGWNKHFWYAGISENISCVDERVRERAKYGRNVLLEGDAWGERTVAWARQKITDIDRRTMIYCDGGDKAREAYLYWPILRPGDLLGLHDYSDDPDAKGPEVYPKDVAYLLAAGKRIGKDELAETRILLLEKQ